MSWLGNSYHVRGRFYEGLATAVDAGLPIDRALGLVAGSGDRLGAAAAQMSGEATRGRPLSEAMAGHRAAFSDFEADAVEAGERAGRLPAVLRRLSRFFGSRGAAADRIANGLIYPLVLLHGAVVLPPLYLLVRDGAGAYLAAVVPLLAAVYGGAAALWWIYRVLTSKPASRGTIDRFVLTLPLVGGMWRSLALADYAHVVATLYAAGIPVVEVLEKAASANRNLVFRDAGRRVAGAVRRGAGLYEALSAEPEFFSRIFVAAIHVGETAGKLEDALQQAERTARDDAERTLERLAAGLPVAAFVVAALIVIVVVLGFWTDLAGRGP